MVHQSLHAVSEAVLDDMREDHPADAHQEAERDTNPQANRSIAASSQRSEGGHQVGGHDGAAKHIGVQRGNAVATGFFQLKDPSQVGQK